MLVVTLSCMVFWFAFQVPRLRTLPAGCVQVRSKEPEDGVGCHVVVYGFMVCVSGPQTPNATSWLFAEVRSKEPEDVVGCHVVVCVRFFHVELI